MSNSRLPCLISSIQVVIFKSSGASLFRMGGSAQALYQVVTSEDFKREKHVGFSDLEQLAKASFATRGLRIVRGHLERLAASGDSLLILAWKGESGKELAGYNLLVHDALESGGKSCPFFYADKVVVHPNHMGKGIGEELVTIPLGITRADHKKMMVGLRTSDTELIPFYDGIKDHLMEKRIESISHTIGNSAGKSYAVFLYGVDRFPSLDIPLAEDYIAGKPHTLEYASFFKRAGEVLVGTFQRTFLPRLSGYAQQ